MLFSVIIPVYNCEATIENIVNNVLDIGLSDYEIILVNDGSSDGTMLTCSMLEEKNSCIKCVHKKNGGVSSARNKGIENAKGEYLLFLDADDSIDSGKLKQAAEIVQKERPDMLVFGISFDYYYRKRMYRRDELVYPMEELWSTEQWSKNFIQLFEYNILSTVCNKFIRHDFVKKDKIFFKEELFELEDLLFVIQYLQKCNMIYLFPETIYHYKQSENERSTYNRLCRIESLSRYMEPFEVELNKLEKTISKKGYELKDNRSVLEQIYNMLFHEQVRYCGYKELNIISKDMINGKFSFVIEEMDPILFTTLSKEWYVRAYFRRLLLHIRHWLAVRVKYFRSHGR